MFFVVAVAVLVKKFKYVLNISAATELVLGYWHVFLSGLLLLLLYFVVSSDLSIHPSIHPIGLGLMPPQAHCAGVRDGVGGEELQSRVGEKGGGGSIGVRHSERGQERGRV